MGISFQGNLAFLLVIVAAGECCLPYEKLLPADDPEVLSLLRVALAKIDVSTDGLKVLSPTLMKYDFSERTYDVKYKTGDGKVCFIKFSKRHWRPVSAISVIDRHCESGPTFPTTTASPSSTAKSTTPSTSATTTTASPSTTTATSSTTKSPSTKKSRKNKKPPQKQNIKQVLIQNK